MIVVVGPPFFRATTSGAAADGLSVRIALVAASNGRSVQMVGNAGEDAEGDAVVLALAQGGVGHVALRRDAGISTPMAPEPEDRDSEGPDDLSSLGTDPRRPRQPASLGFSLDAADVELALRYLTTFSVIVLSLPADTEMARVVTAAAGWADARLIVVVGSGEPVPDGLPPDAIVLEAPDEDPDGVFAELVGAFAAALDDGGDPAAAFEASMAEAGWQPSAEA